MSINCGSLIEQIMQIIDEANNDITVRMTDREMKYKDACSHQKK